MDGGSDQGRSSRYWVWKGAVPGVKIGNRGSSDRGGEWLLSGVRTFYLK